ncbi:hypothetical protein ACU6TU_13125 [Halomonas sp. LS-001]
MHACAGWLMLHGLEAPKMNSYVKAHLPHLHTSLLDARHSENGFYLGDCVDALTDTLNHPDIPYHYCQNYSLARLAAEKSGGFMWKPGKKSIKTAAVLTALSMLFDFGDGGGVDIIRCLLLFFVTVLVFEFFIFFEIKLNKK